MMCAMRKAGVLSILLVVVLLAFAVIADAQQTRLPRIGYASTNYASSPGPLVEAFRQGLRDLGDVAGPNLLGEYRYAEGTEDRRPGHANDLVYFTADVLVVLPRREIRSARPAPVTV